MKATLTLMLITACGCFGSDSRVHAELLRSELMRAVVADSEKVEASILYAEFESPRHMRPKAYTESAPAIIKPEHARDVKKILLVDESYLWDMGRGCLPVYNARLRFQKKNRSVVADICFFCATVRFSFQEEPESHGLLIRHPVAILDILEDYFPRDTVLQKVRSIEQYRRPKKEANKAPEPTPGSVTLRASSRRMEWKQQNADRRAARSAPAPVVAHL